MVLTTSVLESLELERDLPQLPKDAPARAQQLSSDAFAALQEGHYEEALANFRTLGTLRDVDGASYYSKLGMAITWRRQREFSKALKVLNEALGLGDDRLVLSYIGTTLLQMKRFAEALGVFDKVKENWPGDPDVWVYRIPLLVVLGQYQEALESAEQAFPLRLNSSDRGETLYNSAAFASVVFGLSALNRRSLPDLEAATKAFIKWRARARRDKQLAAFNDAVKEFKKALPAEDKETFEEFMLGVRLASIRDPFRRWEAIGKEISKDWPEDVSAVQAIREQRRW